MSRELATMVNALIPGAIGLLIILFPGVFAGKDATADKLNKIKKLGAFLFVISIASVMFKTLSH